MTSKTSHKKLFTKAPIVRLQGQPVLLFSEQYGTLLQALETKKVKIFSECRNGFCGACKTRIISGKVCYLSEPLAELKHDECLPCCCVPITDLELDLSAEDAVVVSTCQPKQMNETTRVLTTTSTASTSHTKISSTLALQKEVLEN
ncbi:ferredoxin [Shewanella morhuae]|uniref:Ferredoxin n=1 Tax=Shewanella morhuae TaxID=365591 RepID=A0ABX5HTL8_9GAMM|nr:class I ribonucleotide reductase maintenance protein YfaE [Shewanella morhuae]PTA50230.1 ferredoxin [Shewanella morhuae]